MKSQYTLIFIFFINITLSFSQPYIDWINIYNNPPNSHQSGTDIALVDTFTYVAGSSGSGSPGSNSNFVLLKLNNHGDTIWTSTLPNYEAPRSIEGIGGGTQIIATDFSGNIYAVGTFMFSTDNYMIIKYNSLGDTIWTRIFDDSLLHNGGGEARAIALDKTGNIIITGGFWNVGGPLDDMDMITLKYDSNGNLLWQRNFYSPNSNNNPNAYNPYGDKIAVDINNNVFIAGDFGLIKYDSAGNLIWSKVDTSFVDIGGEGVTIKIDKNQNIIYSTRNLNNEILKYNQEGNLIDSTNFSPPAYTDNRIYCLTVDNSNNVIVSGGCMIDSLGGNWNDVTIKYDTFLNQIWSRTFVDNSPNYIVSDMADNIYIAGADSFLLLKYDSTGILLWDTLYFSSSVINSEAIKIVLDSVNNIYMTGLSDSTFQKMLTIKYSPILMVSSTQNQFIQNNYSIKIFPNPSNGIINFNGVNLSSTIQIYNSLGAIIYTSKATNDNYSITIDNKANGIYFYRIIDDNAFIQEGKIIVK